MFKSPPLPLIHPAASQQRCLRPPSQTRNSWPPRGLLFWKQQPMT